MRNPERWRPSKYLQRGDRLVASHDPAEVGIGSRLMAGVVAAHYAEYLPRYARGRLGDLGCGKVPLYAAYRGLVSETICVDWANSPHASLHLDAEVDLSAALPFEDARFDTIILSDVLEHLPEPMGLWHEMARLLAPGGHALINVPFMYGLHELPHDFHRYTEFALRRQAQQAGFEVRVLKTVGGSLHVMADMLAKPLAYAPLVGKPLAIGVQAVVAALDRTRRGRAWAERSGTRWPLGYFMVVARMRAQLAGSVAIQVLGAASTFAVGVLIARLQGPVAQGHYGLVRTTADLLLALALFGLPQSLVHVMNQRGASPARLERTSLRYALVLLMLAAAFCAVLALAPGAPLWADGSLALFALLVGTLGWVLQGLQRVFVLVRGTAVQFAWLSVTPALSLFVAIGAMLLATGSQAFEWALAASGIASALLGAWQLLPLRARADWRAGGAAATSELLGAGAHAFAQSAAMALQPWLTLLLLGRAGASPADIGHFVFAAYVYQAFVLPAGFVAPLLFARISRAAGAGRRLEIRGAITAALALTTAAALACAALLPWAVPRVFGSAYAPTVAACVIMAVGGPLVVLNRLGVSVLLGLGRFRAASAHALWRALLVPACLLPCLAAWQGGNLVTAAAASWLLVEALCAAAVVTMWRQGSMAGTLRTAGSAKDEG